MLAKELIRRGFDVTIVAAGFDHVTQTETKSYGPSGFVEEWIDDVGFLWLKTAPYKGNSIARVRNMLGFARSLKHAVHNSSAAHPDVIIGSSPHLLGAEAARNVAMGYDVPFVLEVRDLWPESLVELGRTSRKHPIVLALGALERKLYRESSWIVSLLPAAGEHIARMGGDIDRVTWIPNGIDPSLFMASTATSETPTSRQDLRVVYAGTHGLANALDSIVEAASILQDEQDPRIMFHFYGDGPTRPALEATAKMKQITNVHFEGPVAKHQIPSVLESADILIATLKNTQLYRFGTSLNKLYDYMAAGRPIVLGSPNHDTPVSMSGAGLVVDAENASALAGAVKRLAAMSPEERAGLGLLGKRFVYENHSIGTLADRLALILERVTA